MTGAVLLSEAALRSLLAKHLGFLSGYGFADPVIEADRGRGGWRVFYGSTDGVGLELYVNAELDALWTHLVAPKQRYRWSLDVIANVPNEPDRFRSGRALDDRFAAEAQALESVRDALQGDFSMYMDRTL